MSQDQLALLLKATKLSDIEVTEETLAVESERSAGLGRTKRRGGWRNMIGRQIIQLVPFPFIEDAKLMWDWCAVHYHHVGKGDNGRQNHILWDNAKDVVRKVWETLPGWQFICRQETFGKPCRLCELKWEMGEWYKANTSEGWKHKDLQIAGVFPNFKAMAYVLVHQHAGEWLDTDEGRKWTRLQRKKLRKAPNKGLEKFERGVTEAIEDYEEMVSELEDGDGTVNPVIGSLNKDLHKDLSDIAGNPLFGGAMISPLKGVQFILETTVRSDNGFRKTTVTPHPERRALVVKENGKPDKKAIRLMLQELKNLRGYREYESNEVEHALDERLLQIESMYKVSAEEHEERSGSRGSGGTATTTSYTKQLAESDDEFKDDDFDDEDEDDADDSSIEEGVVAGAESADDLDNEDDDDGDGVDASEPEPDDDEDEDDADGDDEAGDDEGDVDLDALDDDDDVIEVEPEPEPVKKKKKSKAKKSKEAAKPAPKPAAKKKGKLVPTKGEDGEEPPCHQKGVYDDDNDVCSLCPYEMTCFDD